ncbi:RNA polymerase sigma factor (sigma-70 family) [Parabacteroides sp. PF5-5]|uniref:RNA polymerase sigma factor n=1 Tax=unclassified Parabacteroides TaxID=2649774 RepID=UPI002475E5BD|nr:MULTISPECIES: sigma-70 family RNA polymerase sigma factor [unclassified Parabacteroides]MDH6306503.1 RNA polymerase sigma factor (sigma-70 family) [Parabacteroides sp. PH5-39]MDH6317470.1 RNA polymerase sigma factor (sigma-70 family) [Parabacteroides sp. PF5-13]MDH6321227.1 RNA polymerase sigma factor (sigma-70 family) [Parabacteroides sp. PH5-13]MDH6324959.1 RNA polymerase sigma factor (sigma-70 family) [Parabacteroides sp. PH5-8]MDH6328668.1 RNA polymerase sigma factor (sigma-70 family) [
MGQEQFKQEVLPLREQLFYYAQRLLEDLEDAEDVIQEVFLKLWYMRDDLGSYNSIPALSVQITKHLCLNRIKVRQRSREGLDTVVLTSQTLTPEVQLEQKDQVAQVMQIIDQLPGLQQTILRMRHVDGFEVEEIAELTGSKPEAVRMNLSRARKKVKEMFFKIEA